jgi:hypothetical protein
MFNEQSAYCNGENYLFLSGGDYNNNVIIGDFWILNLETLEITKLYFLANGLSHPRKLHSMIYIPNRYVFVVGGIGTKNVEYFDTQTKQIHTHSFLNENRVEPALAYINNSYIYAFGGYNLREKKQLNFFERINLRSDEKGWEKIVPNLDKNVANFNHKFYAVSFHNTNPNDFEVIFLGGNSANPHERDSKTNKNCHIYNCTNNLLKHSNFHHKDIEFSSEKFFYPFSKDNSLLFPHIERDDIKVLIYSENNLKDIKYESYDISRDEEKLSHAKENHHIKNDQREKKVDPANNVHL